MQSADRLLDPSQLRALELLRQGRRFLLTGHVRPDGDCIGAQAALSRVLQAQGKEVTILNPDPPEARFDYLARDCAYRTYKGGALPQHDVAVLLDFSELSRTGPLEKPLAAAPSKKVVIDHHIHHGAAWWDEAFVDSTASATGLIVQRIAHALDVALDVVAARGVFTSLVTDTGWFKYSNTDAETLAAAGEMIRLGVQPTEIFGALYQRRGREHPLAIGRLLSRVEYLADDRVALVVQTRAETMDADKVDTDEMLDILRSVKSIEVVLYLRELPDGSTKLSARSKSDYDVNRLARQFGGGGHKKASGATLSGDLSNIRARVVAAALAGFATEEVPASARER
ncbi:MAG: DHH family phosphoesterase [Planctomycetota bacterium]